MAEKQNSKQKVLLLPTLPTLSFALPFLVSLHYYDDENLVVTE